MKSTKLTKRLRKNRPMIQISFRIPEDVLEDLKWVAPRLGFSGYQPLIRAYIGQGLRADLVRLSEEPEISRLIESLRQHGVQDDVIASAIADVKEAVAAV